MGLTELHLFCRHLPVPPATEHEEASVRTSLARCPDLIALQMLTRVDVQKIDELWTLRNLTELSLRCCTLSTGCENAFVNLSRLRRLLLAQCHFRPGWVWSALGESLSRTAIRDLELRCNKSDQQIRFDSIASLLSRVQLGRLTAAVFEETASLLNESDFEQRGNPKILDVVTLPTQSPNSGTPSLSNSSI